MLPGRYLFVFMVMIWGTNSVPAHAEMIQVTIAKLAFSPEELKQLRQAYRLLVGGKRNTAQVWSFRLHANSRCTV